MKSCETCGSTVQTTTDHNDIGWFRRGKALQAKKSKALKSTKAESSNANRSKTPTKSGCLRNITGVKSYLHKYVEQPGPKIVFGDDSTCATEGYGSVTCNGIVLTKVAFINGLKYNLIGISQLCDAKYIVQFNENRGTIIKSNKEVVMIAPRVVPFEEQSDDLKKKLAKNNKAKMVLYNTLPTKKYERSFMCKTAKDIWQSLVITHQGISSKNYVRKFLRDLHPERAKVTTIEELKDLSSLALDELIGNLKVHEVVMEKDSKIYRGKKERVKSIALKSKKESSDDETLTSESDDEEYAMAVRNFKKFFRRKGKFVRQPREEKKSFRQRNEKKGKSDRKCFRCDSWSDSKNDAKDKTNDETCLMAQSSNEVTLNSSYYSDNAYSLDHDTMQVEYDSLFEISLKFINKNKTLKTKRDLLEKEVLELNEKIKKLKRSKEIDIACKSCQELKLENAKLKETQVKFVKFDKSANSLREMLDNQKSSSCKIGLGFDTNKASTSGTKPICFVGSFAEKAMDGSTIKVHGSTLFGSVSRTNGEKLTEHVFSPPMSSRSDFVITRKKLIHNRIDESNKSPLKPSFKSGIGYVKTESKSKLPPPWRNISSQTRYNTPQPRRNFREPIH
ncbi:hypothetical protein Tco_0911469 [Tanacetum coccineum]|uniref:Retrovirus-related Pol polyprotein from transposon TNT 1-94-like beta-barrel domain-containing protein n=1 Tax=Tanacetum coccineum TaxID=301880 RepID=A0ABQ5D308_9ASTR